MKSGISRQNWELTHVWQYCTPCLTLLTDYSVDFDAMRVLEVVALYVVLCAQTCACHWGNGAGPARRGKVSVEVRHSQPRHS